MVGPVLLSCAIITSSSLPPATCAERELASIYGTVWSGSYNPLKIVFLTVLVATCPKLRLICRSIMVPEPQSNDNEVDGETTSRAICFRAMFLGHLFRLAGLFFKYFHSPVLLLKAQEHLVAIHAGVVNDSIQATDGAALTLMSDRHAQLLIS
ncbi:hypothetical protein LZ30DRAFT_769000 [Colletotrichum cereale]|nr:hypothetical protein LZ30DRAFT_769000 [Colletotrichum cereale]